MEVSTEEVTNLVIEVDIKVGPEVVTKVDTEVVTRSRHPLGSLEILTSQGNPK